MEEFEVEVGWPHVDILVFFFFFFFFGFSRQGLSV